MIRFLVAALIALSVPAWAMAQAVDANGHYVDPYLALDPGAHSARLNRLDVDRDGRYVVTASYDKTVRVWSAADGRLLRTIRLPAGPGAVGQVRGIAISPDGQLIAAGGWTSGPGQPEFLYLFDRATGALVHRFVVQTGVEHAEFSPDGRRILVTGRNGPKIFDVVRRTEIRADQSYGGENYWAAFAPDGRIVTTSYDGQIRLYQPDLRQIDAKVAASSGRPFGIAFSPDGSRIAVAYDDSTRIDVLDGHTLRFLFSADTSGIQGYDMSKVAWSADGSVIAGGRARDAQHRNFVRIWSNGGRGPHRDVAVSAQTIMSIRPLGSDSMVVGSSDPAMAVIRISGAMRFAVDQRILSFVEQELAISPEGHVAQTRSARGGQDWYRFDLRRRLLTRGPADSSSLIGPATVGLKVTGWEGGDEGPSLSGILLPLERGEPSHSIAIAPDGKSFLLGTAWHVRHFAADGTELWKVHAPDDTRSVNLSQDGRLAVATHDDGTIRWYRRTDGVELLAVFMHGDGQRWVAWTPRGYYSASPGGEDLIRWVVNRGVDTAPDEYPVGAFRDRFYRPDVVERVLDELDIDKAVQVADRERGVQSARATAAVVRAAGPPVVSILDPAEGANIDRAVMEVAYEIRGRPGDRIRRLRALVDNRQAAAALDLEIPASGALTGTVSVPITGISPTLILIAENEVGSSAPASVKLSGGIRPIDSNKPVLYVLAIGVSEYQKDARLRLQYADDDARAFVERMRRQKGGMYRDVVVRQLIDRDATTAAILDGLFWLRRQMSGSDVAAVFISAHGERDGRNDLYLISHDADVRDEIAMQSSAVEWDDVQKALTDLGSRGKTLVFLDACKSGQVIPGKRSALPPDLDRAINELKESGNDVTVFSSSTGAQLSQEKAQLGHGYFTYALLEALDGRGTRSGAYLTTGDLDRHLKDRVKILSGGSQTPVTSRPVGAFSSPPLFIIQ